MGKMNVTECGELRGNAFLLTAYASRRWGAYEADGVDSPEAHDFRNRLRFALRTIADERGSIEVFAAGGPVDAPDWTLDVIEPSVSKPSQG